MIPLSNTSRIHRDASECAPNIVSDDDGLVRVHAKILILEESDRLKLKLLSISFANGACHRSGKAIAHVSKEQFLFNGMTVDAKSF